MSWHKEIDGIRKRREMARGMGGPDRIARQHAMGRLTVRERIDGLVDPGSFVEIGQLVGTGTYEQGVLTSFVPDPYVAGLATIGGRDVVVAGEDFTVRGGSGSGSVGRNKRDMAFAMAKEYRIPLVQFLDGAGASIQTIESLGRSYVPNSKDWSDPLELLGQVPMIGGIMGAVAGGIAAYALLTHWTCMVQGAELFAAGPAIVKRAIGAEVTKQQLGGTGVHVHTSGIADNEAVDEQDCFDQMAAFLSYLPQSVWELPPYLEPDDRPDRREEELLTIVPRESRRGYDMRRLIELVVDKGSIFEVKPYFGRCVITALARMNGHVVGVIANDPLVQAGAVDAAGADKTTHFMELCDTFRIPLIHFVDVPGFMVGPEAEADGTLRAGMRTLWLAHQITVPSVAVHVRRCYGMAGVATSTPARLGLRLGWPSGEWGSLPIEGGVETAYRRLIAGAADPDRARQEIEARLMLMKSVFPIAEAFGIEDLIDPRDTRPLLIRYLEAAIPRLAHELGPKPRYGVRP
ncbi:carboxyl transferase domain-containing protein [Dactylosporangium sp. AC04546]|uniref:acyl-CoA carboxylase subunit beta n=1 Tax=Dactylosporangium sp. AC04546 TaxID=2862460 RepID=UPI001EDEDEB9|nr:carboxyl transferase domain-containing protein [Dactylosporangium sp. AC04546]WVK86974.1 carboxyl transferase domain-containing protein [Dactylosporangium sp. AC04546]